MPTSGSRMAMSIQVTVVRCSPGRLDDAALAIVRAPGATPARAGRYNVARSRSGQHAGERAAARQPAIESYRGGAEGGSRKGRLIDQRATAIIGPCGSARQWKTSE